MNEDQELNDVEEVQIQEPAQEEESIFEQIGDSVRDIAEEVESWFVKHFHGVNMETDLYNKFYRAKEELKTTLGDK